MIEILKKIILVAILLTGSSSLFAQDFLISTRSEHITVEKDTSFVRNVSITFKQHDIPTVYPIMYDSELEEVSNVQVLTKRGKRFKALKDIITFDEDVELEYIASKKIKSILIPPETEAKITYTVKCSELMYFSDLRFFSYHEIDTIKYQVTVPKNFHFVHNTIYQDSLKHFTIDSVVTSMNTKWTIEATPIKVKPDPLMLFGIYRNKKIPLMRTVVTPSSYEGRETQYMNDWYFQKVATRRGLSPKVVQKIHTLTEGITDPKELIDVLYKYVHHNFKYVAIEVGMGAFVPTHANEVFTNKQGDCKDLSNFLSEILNYKGIKSDIALAATFSHISDCDFPSLSAANHAICVAYIEGKPIILDPTDPIHLAYTPVESLQNQSILIINKDGGEFYKTASFSGQENLIDYQIELEANSDQMVLNGKFNVDYNGISGNFLKRMFKYAGTNDVDNVSRMHYESVFGNQAISEMERTDAPNALSVNGKLTVNGKLFNDGDDKLLFLDFLPRLFESENRETLLKGTHIGTNFNKKVNLKIRMNEPLLINDPIEHTFSKQGAQLKIKINSISDYIIECNYEFEFDYINIEKSNLELTNDLLNSFKKIINAPILLTKKG